MSDARPSAAQLRERLDELAPPGYAAGARPLLVKVIGSWAAGCYAAPHAICLRALYVLPASSYLGIGSWCDEYELVSDGGEVQIDFVAFEVEKAARLVLKGHRPTLEWLSGADALVRTEEAGVIEAIAADRRRQLAGIDPKTAPPPVERALYDALDAWVRGVRSGR